MIGLGSRSFREVVLVTTAVLTGLKLTGGIDWSWVAITTSVWLPIAVSVSLRLAALAILLAAAYLVSGGTVGRLQQLVAQIPLPRELSAEGGKNGGVGSKGRAGHASAPHCRCGEVPSPKRYWAA